MLGNICRTAPVVAKKEGGESKGILKTRTYEQSQGESFMSIFTKSTVTGPNLNLAKGPRDDLLL